MLLNISYKNIFYIVTPTHRPPVAHPSPAQRPTDCPPAAHCRTYRFVRPHLRSACEPPGLVDGGLRTKLTAQGFVQSLPCSGCSVVRQHQDEMYDYQLPRARAAYKGDGGGRAFRIRRFGARAIDHGMSCPPLPNSCL